MPNEIDRRKFLGGLGGGTAAIIIAKAVGPKKKGKATSPKKKGK